LPTAKRKKKKKGKKKKKKKNILGKEPTGAVEVEGRLKEN